ncbi:ATP-binding protein [Lysinibacillus sp. BW-2-10]|uniref:ATP-binding protein n=1 Tax=Lysinibacillus sp. BW-2-10 TaxID=2590030 RepID=UPI00117C7F3E|nr:ATP-binding protein [Lysinibacillus sp. BW-2-10]TSI03068.1 hypothetical protein FJQ64_16240 [Lysinibacillus sp. BW-2-10]
MKKQWIIFMAVVVVIVIIFLPRASVAYGSSSNAEKGVLDLSNNDGGPYKLNGKWEFYWNELLTPEDFQNRSAPKIYTHVPHQWKDLVHNGKQLSSFGFATYRLTILLSESSKGRVKAIALPNIASSYKLWINGNEMEGSGTVGTTEKTSVASNSLNLVTFIPEQEKVEIVIQVSNFSQRKSGIWSTIEFGDQQALVSKNKNYYITNGLIVGGLLFISIYHFVMYFFRRKEKISLFFSLSCFGLAVRMLFLEGHMTSFLLTSPSWEVMQKVEYISTYFSLTCFNFYLYYFLGLQHRKKYLYLVVVIHMLLTLFVLMTPGKIHTLIFPYYSIIIILIFLNLAIKSFYAINRQEKAYIYNFIAILLFFILVVNDILYYLNFIQTMDLTPLGLLIYVFLQALLLSARISFTFNQEEMLKEQLKKANASLEQKVESRTKEIVQINHQLQHALDARLELISTISHEMRSPLTTIKSYSKGMIDGVILDEQNKHTKLIYDETTFMERMLDDLFELSLLELGQYKFYFEQVEPVSFFRKLFQKYHYEVTQLGLEFFFKETNCENVLIQIDPIRIEQVFINLIRNAMKNTATGHITVEVNCELYVSVSIIDTGRGIEPHLIQNLFTKFFKGNDSTNSKSTGIGLSICKEIIKSHYGEIFVTSEIGKGSTFTFTIPTTRAMGIERDNASNLEHA